MSKNFAFVLVMVAGCGGSDNTFHPADLSGIGSGSDMAMPGGSDGGNPTDGGTACVTYTMSTIANMRQNGKAGDCFEVDNVLVNAVHNSSTSPRLFVQDTAGGDFSALVINCPKNSTIDPCTQQMAVNSAAAGDSVTIKGKYIHSSAAKGSLEGLYVDSFTDNGAFTGTKPAALALQLTDIERGAYQAKNAYQKVTVTISAADTLKMYDWSPAEFVYSGGTCMNGMKGTPYQFGFGMIPSSVTPTTAAGSACAGTTAQPTGVATPDPHEVLFGTDFYASGFIVTSDCRCAAGNMDKLVTATSTVTGTLNGVLLYDTSGSMGYQYISPQLMTDAAFTNLM